MLCSDGGSAVTVVRTSLLTNGPEHLVLGACALRSSLVNEVSD